MKQGIHWPIHWLGVLGLIGFLCGCQGTQPAAPEINPEFPPKTQVKLVALADLNVPGKHENKNLGAYFILVDEDELLFFESYFKDNVPRVVLSAGNNESYPDLARDSAGGAIDKVTHKPGVLLGFQKIEIKDDSAHVELVESPSLTAIHIHVFEMQLQKGKWTILVHSRRAVPP